MAINLDTKFEVTKFGGTSNFGLWKKRINDLLAQQSLHKAMCKTKPTDTKDTDWAKIKEEVVRLTFLLSRREKFPRV